MIYLNSRYNDYHLSSAPTEYNTFSSLYTQIDLSTNTSLYATKKLSNGPL